VTKNYYRDSAIQEIINLSRLMSDMAQKTASTVKLEATSEKVSFQFGKKTVSLRSLLDRIRISGKNSLE
jgi:hypothetical protein